MGRKKIQRANLDGSNIEDLVTSGLGRPGSIAIDKGAGKMYWSDQETDKIQRANLDGTNIEDLIASAGVGTPGPIALIPAGPTSIVNDHHAESLQEFVLNDAYPNPFNPFTSISYGISEPAHISLTVYNILGEEVIRLVNSPLMPGRYTAIWRGTNSLGVNVASGIYLYHLVSSTGFVETKAVVLLR